MHQSSVRNRRSQNRRQETQIGEESAESHRRRARHDLRGHERQLEDIESESHFNVAGDQSSYRRPRDAQNFVRIRRRQRKFSSFSSI